MQVYVSYSHDVMRSGQITHQLHLISMAYQNSNLKNVFIFSGNSVVRVRAQVMMRDDSTGGWVPMGGGGLSNVSVRKRKIHHEEMNDQPCKHEYLIYGRRISDQSVSYYCC